MAKIKNFREEDCYLRVVKERGIYSVWLCGYEKKTKELVLLNEVFRPSISKDADFFSPYKSCCDFVSDNCRRSEKEPYTKEELKNLNHDKVVYRIISTFAPLWQPQYKRIAKEDTQILNTIADEKIKRREEDYIYEAFPVPEDYKWEEIEEHDIVSL